MRLFEALYDNFCHMSLVNATAHDEQFLYPDIIDSIYWMKHINWFYLHVHVGLRVYNVAFWGISLLVLQ